MWRGDLSPLGCEAAPKWATLFFRHTASTGFATAAQPNGDKSPRHKSSSHRARLPSAMDS
ncbi:hypothetical protein DJ564_01225 [Pseudomonas sp. 31-12]|nr:hypothetical protein DJ564_01225 [Pseudomonas sp. 31-12]